jgi:hypothetical protein
LNWDGIDSKHIENLSGKCEKTRTLQRLERRREGGDNVRTNLQATAHKLDLIQENAQRRPFVNTKMKFNSRKNRRFSKSAE